jgi:hypothetical protein
MSWRWLPVTLHLMAAGCTYWETYPATAIAAEQRLPSSLRVAPSTAGPLLLVHPYLRSDTLFGRSGGNTVGFPVGELRAVERQRVDALRTTGLILVTSGAWITLGLLTGGLE